MKKLGLLIISFVMAATFAGCGSANSIASGDAAANLAGQTCAQALTGLYSSYKSTGSINVTNTTDLSNMLVVATSYSQLKQNKDNAAYKTAFTNGMISGSNLITAANATSIVGNLINSTALANVNAQNIAKKAETVAAILALVKALK